MASTCPRCARDASNEHWSNKSQAVSQVRPHLWTPDPAHTDDLFMPPERVRSVIWVGEYPRSWQRPASPVEWE